jgi:adenylate cyclase, class 2
MPIEIEAKIKVSELVRYAETLKAQGAVFQGEVLQRDVFFDRPGGDLIRKSCGLRLRRETRGQQTLSQLCFKGPVQRLSSLKKREELEFTVSDAEQAESLLRALGVDDVMTVEKRRALWRLGNCTVCLDEVTGLGWFVEIEGPDESHITQAAESLGLDCRNHIPDSYAKLLARQK